MSLSVRLKHELKAVALATLYFGAWIGAFILLKTLVLEEYAIDFSGWSKVLRTALYSAGVFIVLMLERGPRERHAAGGFAPALGAGISDAWKVLAEKNAEFAAGKLTSVDVFGAREQLKNNYANRFLAAVAGIWGNTAAEAMYPAYRVDTERQPLDGAKAKYTVRLAPGQLPPVDAFWSATMYELPASLLYANPLDRYLINSPMLLQLKRDTDGGLTLYVQHELPGKDKEANWLPGAPRPVLDRPAPLLAQGRGAQRRVETAAAGKGEVGKLRYQEDSRLR